MKTDKKIEEITFTFGEFQEALKIADKIMKENNGHQYQTTTKTRCIYCGRSPRDKRRCGSWFQTFVGDLEMVLLNKETYLQSLDKGDSI